MTERIANHLFAGAFLLLLWAIYVIEERTIRAKQRRRWMQRSR